MEKLKFHAAVKPESYQSNPAANDGSIAGAISLAQDVMNFSALDFLKGSKQQ